MLLGLALLGYLTDGLRTLDGSRQSSRLALSPSCAGAATGRRRSPLSASRTRQSPGWALTVPYFALYAVTLGYTLWAPILIRDALGTSDANTGFIVGGISLLSAAFIRSPDLIGPVGRALGLAAFALALDCAGCIGVGLFSHSLLRVTALAFIPISTSLFMSPFWCLPTKFLEGTFGRRRDRFGQRNRFQRRIFRTEHPRLPEAAIRERCRRILWACRTRITG